MLCRTCSSTETQKRQGLGLCQSFTLSSRFLLPHQVEKEEQAKLEQEQEFPTHEWGGGTMVPETDDWGDSAIKMPPSGGQGVWAPTFM